MPGNTSILTNLVASVQSFVSSTSEPGVSEVVTQDDYRHADEEAGGVLGRFLPVPVAIVSATGQFSLLEAPCLTAEVTVTVRHSMEASTLETHQASATAIFDALFDQAALLAHVNADAALVASDVLYTGQTFQRVGRAYESAISFSITVASVAT